MQTYATRKTASPPLTSNRAMSKAPRLSNSDILNTLGELPSREIDLSAAMTAKINERFGTPLNGLRVFRDSGLEDMGQRAFAHGNEIHIAGNESASDERLMLHEATHVVQQGSGLAQGSGLLQNSSLEAQANANSYVGSFAMPTSGEGPIQGWNPITFMAKYARKAVKRFWHGKKKSDDATMKGFYERTDLPAADVLEPEARAVPDEDITPGGVAKMAAGGVADTSNYLGLALNNVFTTPGKMAEAVDGKGTPNPVLSAMSVDGDTAPGNLALDTFGGTMSAVGGLTKMALSANAAHKARKSGNTSGAVGGVVDVFKAAGGAATGAAKIAGTIGANVPAQVIPGLGVFTGGLQFAKGVVDMADAGANRSNLTRLINASPGSTEDDRTMERTLRQAHKTQAIRQTGAGFDMAAGALSALGGASTLSGIAAPAGVALTAAAPIVGMAGGAVTDEQKRRQRLNTVEEMLHMNGEYGQIKSFRERLSEEDSAKLTDRDIKHILLRKMGFQNYKHAYKSITTNRARALTDDANLVLPADVAADDPRVARKRRAAEALEAMGLSRVDGEFKQAGAAAKLGVH